jgi:ATP-dependent Clp protease ATP-binding subunit ClpA
MLERFEPAARQALVDARNEAGRAGQDKIRCEHVLLGLLAEPGTAADALAAAGLTLDGLRARVPRGSHPAPVALDADALASLGIDLDAVRRATDAAFGPGALDHVQVPGRRRLMFAEDAKRTLASAVRQAHQRGQREITSGHMLVAIIDQPRNGALALMSDAGINIPALRADVLSRIAPAA